jgi:hypothetical protein
MAKILKFDGGYFTYSMKRNTVSLSHRFEDAFVFTNENDVEHINGNIRYYQINMGEFEDIRWQNPEWIDVRIGL